MSEQETPDTNDVTIDGYCDCFRYDMEETLVPCGGECGSEIRLHRAINEAVHLDGKHWHLHCVFESVVRSRRERDNATENPLPTSVVISRVNSASGAQSFERGRVELTED